MNTVTIFLTIISVLICTKQYITSAIEQNVTPYLNERLQRYINDLFYHLKINTNFRHSFKTKLLLVMYRNLNNAIEYNWKVYSNIKKKVAIPQNKTDDFLFNVVQEALQNYQEYFNITTELNKTKHTEVSTSNEEGEHANSYKNDGTEAAVSVTTDAWNYIFMNQFVEKIKELTAKDLIGEPVNKTYLVADKKKIYRLPFRRTLQLKTWDPNEYTNTTTNRRMNTIQLVEKYPFIASVHVGNKFICTGSIISKDAVITSASCFNIPNKIQIMIRSSSNMITVRVGSDYADKYGEEVPATDVAVHPQYNSKTMKNNLAIIRVKLKKHARNRPKIRKIRLGFTETRSPMDRIQIFGYRGDAQNRNKLELADLDMLSLKDCYNAYSRTMRSTENFCAGVNSRRSANCNCRSGGPAVSGGFLVGIVSYGPPICGQDNKPTVFTKLSFFLSWINASLVQNWEKQSSALSTSSNGKFMSTRIFYEDDDPKLWTVGLIKGKHKSLTSKDKTKKKHNRQNAPNISLPVKNFQHLFNGTVDKWDESHSFEDLTLLRNKQDDQSIAEEAEVNLKEEQPPQVPIAVETQVQIEGADHREPNKKYFLEYKDHPVLLSLISPSNSQRTVTMPLLQKEIHKKQRKPRLFNSMPHTFNFDDITKQVKNNRDFIEKLLNMKMIFSKSQNFEIDKKTRKSTSARITRMPINEDRCLLNRLGIPVSVGNINRRFLDNPVQRYKANASRKSSIKSVRMLAIGNRDISNYNYGFTNSSYYKNRRFLDIPTKTYRVNIRKTVDNK